MYNCYTRGRKLKCAGRDINQSKTSPKSLRKRQKTNKQTPNPWILQMELKEGHTGIIIF